MQLQRITALLILVIPGFLSVFGWKLMRDTFMNYTLQVNDSFQWFLFILGLFLFIFGIIFIAGFVFYRDKKRRRVQKRFLNDLDE